MPCQTLQQTMQTQRTETAILTRRERNRPAAVRMPRTDAFSKRSVFIYPLSQGASGVLTKARHLLGDGVPTVNKTERVLPLLCAVL